MKTERSSSRAEAAAGPRGGIWELPLSQAPLAFVDLEMTGLDAERHRVIEICIERVVGTAVERMATLIRPPDIADPIGNVRFHGIVAAQIASAPSFADVADRVQQLLRDAVLVAHGARWDVAFLAAELARIGVAWSCPHYLDTLALSRRLLAARSHRLQLLARDLGIDSPSPHRAENDVAVVRALFAHLTADLAASTPRDLWALSHAKRSVKPGILDAAQQAVNLGRPARVCYRPSGRPKQELLFQATAVRTDLDPPVVLGYLQPTRGRRELRADRIVTFEPIDHES